MDALGYIHLLAAVAALAAGTAVLLTTKGSLRHVRAGRTYLVAMLMLNISALGIYRISGGFGAFHLMALLSLATLLLGVALLRRAGPAGVHHHGYLMAWSFIGLVAAAVSEFATHVLRWPPSAGVVGTSVAVCVAGGLLLHTRGAVVIHRVAAARIPGTPVPRPPY